MRVLQLIFNEMSTKGELDENGYETHYPANLAEIQIIKDGVARLDAIGCTDPDIVAQRESWRKIAYNAPRRAFHGSWKMVIIAFLVVLFLGWGLHPFASVDTLKDETAAQAELKSQITSTASSLESDKEFVRTAAPDKREGWQKLADKSQQKLQHLKSITPAQYLIEYNSDAKKAHRQNVVSFFGWLLIPVLYFVSGLTPMYLAIRRRSLVEKWRGAWGIAGKILAVIVGIFMSIEVTETVTHWSDGSKTTESDLGPVLFIKIMALILVLVVFLYLIFYVLPILILFNFVLNYGPGLGEKMFPRRPGPAF
jgi:ABC-type multidrug transport system fused ATPase/permease subunit